MPKIEFVTMACVVCDEEVVMTEDNDGEDPLCIDHFFTEDPTAEWEADDAGK